MEWRTGSGSWLLVGAAPSGATYFICYESSAAVGHRWQVWEQPPEHSARFFLFSSATLARAQEAVEEIEQAHNANQLNAAYSGNLKNGKG